MPIPLDTVAAHMSATVSRLELVLRGHLWIESLVNGVIENRMKNPAALNLDRMSFAAKIDLAFALGAIDSDNVGWFRALNKMRNRLAHNLDGEPTPEELADLADNVGGFARELLDDALDNAIPLLERVGRDRLRAAFLIQMLILEYSRLHETWRRENEASLASYRMQRALFRMSGQEVSPQKDAELRDNWAIPPEPRPGDAFDPPLNITRARSSSRGDAD